MIRILTWNIWHKNNWLEVAELIKENKADIIVLQEVDVNNERTGFANVCEKITEFLGFYSAFSPSIEKADGSKYGNCVISKYPIVESKRHFLSTEKEWVKDSREKMAETEPRTLLETAIQVNSKTICVMTLHLGYSKEFSSNETKTRQIEKVLEVLKYTI